MTDGGGENTPNAVPRGRYHVNLVLFLILVIMFTVWLHSHVYLYLTESIFIGTGLTLWGLWKLVQSSMKWWGWGEQNSIPPHLLGSSNATESLILAIVFLSILYLTTSSLYLFYEGASSGQVKFEVQVLHKDNPYLENITVASHKRVAGRPFFFHLYPFGSPLNLKFKIINPRGYENIERNVYSWTSMRVRVPLDFSPKEFHVVRLIPGSGIFTKLPKPNDTVQVPYYLQIVRGGTTYTLENLLRQSVYAGTKYDEDVEWLIEKEKEEERLTIFRNYLASARIPEKDREDIILFWESNSRIISTVEFKGQDSVSIEIGRIKPDGTKKLVMRQEEMISSAPGIQTIFLEVKN